MKNSSVTLGIIGCGRWGINHVKTAYGLLGEQLKYVVDANPASEKKISQISSSINFTTDINQVLNDAEINAVILATPAITHFSIAKECLIRKKNVLVEKPITLYSHEAKELVELAKANNCKLMVGHVLLYHPAIVELKRLYVQGKIGALQYIYSNRLNLGAIRSEENSLWSFAPHDVSIIQYLTETNPVTVDANGASIIQHGIEDTTITYLSYPNNIHAHIFVSWLHPFKEHRLVVIGSEGMLVFEDSLKDSKLKLFPKGFHKTERGIEKFEGEFEVIAYEEKQPLAEEHKHFYNCITNNTTPLTDGEHALNVLKILEQATEKLLHHGN